MIPVRVYHYRDPAAVAIGLSELGKRGLSARGILFVAIDPRGETYIAVPEQVDAVNSLRVGDKMTLTTPWQGRYFHIDSVHRLPGDTVLWNGDRRLGDTGSAPEVACALAQWLKDSRLKSIFVGCNSHQPGAWWTENERSSVIDLHASGLVDAVVTAEGLLARRIGEPGLFHLSFASLRHGGARTGWTKVYESSLGNILMIERRVLNYSLALSCEGGLIELDVSGLPDELNETGRVQIQAGIGIVGRIDGGAFAVTKGRIEPWGLADVSPAVLVASPNQTLADLPAALSTVLSDL